MSFELRPINDLVMIANAGGGFELDAKLRPTNDLVMIANAAARGNAIVILYGMKLRPTNDLVMIANAGKGKIQFRADDK